MSARALTLNNPYAGTFALGSGVSFNNLTGNTLSLRYLDVQELHVLKLYVGGEDQVADIYFYGYTNVQQPNADGLVTLVEFPEPLYDGAPGDPFAASAHITIVKDTAVLASPPANLVATPGSLAPQGAFMQRVLNNGEVDGLWITMPRYINVTTSTTPAIFSCCWYVIGVTPQAQAAPWRAITFPPAASWTDVPGAGGTGYSTASFPMPGGLVGLDLNALNTGGVGALVIPAGGYASDVDETIDFPYTFQPVASTSAPSDKSPQSPIVTHDLPQRQFWIQTMTIGEAYGLTFPCGRVNISQAMMLGSQGNDGLSNPWITGITTLSPTFGYGCRFRVYTEAAPVPQQDTPLFLQVILGWGLADPTLATPVAGLPRQSLGVGRFPYSPSFFKNTASIGNIQSDTTTPPRVRIMLGCSSGVPTGDTGAPLSLSGTRWFTNQLADQSSLYLSDLYQTAGYFSGNPNFPLIPGGSVVSSNVFPDGFFKYTSPPTGSTSATDGYANVSGYTYLSPLA
jgi:hypothetical protein